MFPFPRFVQVFCMTPLGIERYLRYVCLFSIYSYQATCDFLQKNALLSIIRAHEAQDAG